MTNYVCHLNESQMQGIWGEHNEQDCEAICNVSMTWQQQSRAWTQANKQERKAKTNVKPKYGTTKGT